VDPLGTVQPEKSFSNGETKELRNATKEIIRSKSASLTLR
jgi:hypothetical protein